MASPFCATSRRETDPPVSNYVAEASGRFAGSGFLADRKYGETRCGAGQSGLVSGNRTDCKRVLVPTLGRPFAFIRLSAIGRGPQPTGRIIN